MLSIFLYTYIVSLLSMLIIDGTWLFLTANVVYRAYIGHLIGKNFFWGPAATFYLLYGVGVSVLVILPALQTQKSLGTVFAQGALLGLVTYGAYDLTNQATIASWPLIITVIDMAWGSCMTGMVCAITYALMQQR